VAPGQDGAQVKVGDERLFFLADRPGHNGAVRRDDHAIGSLLSPLDGWLQCGSPTLLARPVRGMAWRWMVPLTLLLLAVNLLRLPVNLAGPRGTGWLMVFR
jgi:hypothetical protein